MGNRRIRFVIVLDSCCGIGLVFIKDRPVSSFWVLRFRSRVLRFRDLGVFVFEVWVLRFRFRVLRFRVLGASFSRFGCFVLRSSFSSASFSKLPSNMVELQDFSGFQGFFDTDWELHVLVMFSLVFS